MILLHLVEGPPPARIEPGPEGFVHLCTTEQAPEVIARFFAGRAVHALTIDAARLDPARLRWEDLYGHGVFPHYYGPIPVEAMRTPRGG